MKKINAVYIRAFISSGVLILFLFMFLGAVTLAAGGLGLFLLSLQFVPSLLKIISIKSYAFLYLSISLAAAGAFGRVYCSFLCPLGAFQDVFIFLSRKIKRKNFHFKSPYRLLRYAILLLAVLSYVFGLLTLINLLDPYSSFGRIIVHIFKPLIEAANNLLVFATESLGFYVFSPAHIQNAPVVVFCVTAACFSIVFILAARHGRLYCNTLCPVGAFLGLLSRISLYNFNINHEKCTKCGQCAARCRACCIDIKTGIVDLSRCVSCFECRAVCPEQAISYALIAKRKKKTSTDPSRRKLILTGILAGTGLVLSGTPFRSAAKNIAEPPIKFPVTAPGSLSLDHFTDHCTACQLCVSVCHTHVLRPAVFEYGLKGFLQPVMDFSKGRCDYECNKCTQVCPADAITKLSMERKKQVQIGIVQFIKEKCIVYTKNRDCAACAEVCPTHAVYTVTEKNIRHPRLKPEVCVGCGACEFVCPVREMPKAIYVKANKVHAVADPPFFQNRTTPGIEIKPGADEEFPF